MAIASPVLRHERDIDGTPLYLVSFWADGLRYSIGFHVGSELIDAMCDHCLDDRTIEAVFGFVNDAVDAELAPPIVRSSAVEWFFWLACVAMLAAVMGWCDGR